MDYHGEWDIKLHVDDDMDYSRDDIDVMLNDQFRDVAQAGVVYNCPNEDAMIFYSHLFLKRIVVIAYLKRQTKNYILVV